MFAVLTGSEIPGTCQQTLLPCVCLYYVWVLSMQAFFYNAATDDDEAELFNVTVFYVVTQIRVRAARLHTLLFIVSGLNLLKVSWLVNLSYKQAHGSGRMAS